MGGCPIGRVAIGKVGLPHCNRVTQSKGLGCPIERGLGSGCPIAVGCPIGKGWAAP